MTAPTIVFDPLFMETERCVARTDPDRPELLFTMSPLPLPIRLKTTLFADRPPLNLTNELLLTLRAPVMSKTNFELALPDRVRVPPLLTLRFCKSMTFVPAAAEI